MTGRDLVTASLRLIGAVAPGESLASQEATDGLAALNRMIGSWSNESLLIHAQVREEFTLTANDQNYTMGSSGNFNTSRPIKINAATIEDQTSSPMIEVPLIIIRTSSEWAQIITKEATSAIPNYLFVEGTFPLETLNLYPMPTVAHKLVIYSDKPLTSIATIDTSVSLPPGYDEALIYNLAIRLSPEYGRSATAEIALIATESKAVIKRTNEKASLLTVDSALVPRGGFDIYSGGSR